MNTLTLTPESHTRGVRSTVLWLLAIMALLLGGFVYQFTRPQPMSPQALEAAGAVLFDVPRRLTPFTLQDQHGQPFTPERLTGHWNLLFFGFTHCPDMCPEALASLNQVAAALARQGVAPGSVQYVFVSLDPARDGPAELAPYVRHFNPGFVGVTGEFLSLHGFATELNVAFTKVPGNGENYQVDHSGNLVLINPRGDYQGFIRQPLQPERIAAVVESLQMRWDQGVSP